MANSKKIISPSKITTNIEDKLRLEKRKKVTPDDPATMTRTKICTKCSKSFHIKPGKKFYLCAECYQRTFLNNKNKLTYDTRVLTQIICSVCGIREYLPFIPNQQEKMLCRSCYSEQKSATFLPPPIIVE